MPNSGGSSRYLNDLSLVRNGFKSPYAGAGIGQEAASEGLAFSAK